MFSEFSEKDLTQISNQGIDLQTINNQIRYFEKGFPFMHLAKAATIGDGVMILDDEQLEKAKANFEAKANTLELIKFVPASGAATRMFKALFGYLEQGKSDKSTDQFFERLNDFAFAEDLQQILPQNAQNQSIADYFLAEKGLGYGSLPKGLLKFHTYENTSRTAAEEHLVEGANYANAAGKVAIHFTVSPEHKPKFLELMSNIQYFYEALFGVKYEISFSEQKPSTDTIAVNLDNSPFREKDGSLLFRPAGHGALLANLNDINADIVFIKNVDNVVPDRLKSSTYDYKKALAGILLAYQSKIFAYQTQLEIGYVSDTLLVELATFLAVDLCVMPPEGFAGKSREEKIEYFAQKLNRPLRVCGMVKNVGEPGGGPFWCKNADESTSLQIVESAQVAMDNDIQKQIFANATHFNPVDLICSLKNHKGHKFDLMAFRDPLTGFSTEKSKDGKDLKAQELPGLWNGSMADWNTLFVEVPLITFNPVKTVNDLLRNEHQPS